MSWLLRRVAAVRGSAGFTLIEVLVGMVLMGIIGTVMLSIVLGANTSANASRTEQDLNEEARLALNRMARELRQATAITAVRNPDGPAYDATAITSVTFTADFTGDGCIDGVAPSPLPTPAPVCGVYQATNPETLTYCWDPTASVRQLYIIPGSLAGNTCQAAGAQPILAGQVTSLKFSYRSNQYLWDANGDGITTWLELDQADPPTGDGNGVLDSNELPAIDSVVIDVGVAAGTTHAQSYETQIDLRNLS
jgi:prepilin-type N-terminal cleavage/methylation domain-containing protein